MADEAGSGWRDVLDGESGKAIESVIGIRQARTAQIKQHKDGVEGLCICTGSSRWRPCNFDFVPDRGFQLFGTVINLD